MATTPTNLPLTVRVPEDLRSYVIAQVDSGAFGNPTDYVRELILDDRERHGLEDKLFAAMRSEPIEITDQEWEHGDIVTILEDKLSLRP